MYVIISQGNGHRARLARSKTFFKANLSKLEVAMGIIIATFKNRNIAYLNVFKNGLITGFLRTRAIDKDVYMANFILH